jgi:type IV pilus modification protein PilV
MTMSKKNNSGFTLIEVLITIAILSVGILGVMTMQIRATSSNAEARKVTESTSWVSDQFERLMAIPYDDGQMDPGNYTPVNTIVNNPNAAFSEVGPYTVTYTVFNEDNPIPNVKAIDVTVTWDTGDQRTLSFRYYKADTF